MSQQLEHREHVHVEGGEGVVEELSAVVNRQGNEYRLANGRLQRKSQASGLWFVSAHDEATVEEVRDGKYATEPYFEALIVTKLATQAKHVFEKAIREIQAATEGRFEMHYRLDAGAPGDETAIVAG